MLLPVFHLRKCLITIFQEKIAMSAIPIWKDKTVSLGSSSVAFRIMKMDDSSIIYQGKAYKAPGAGSVPIRINEICADYLVNALPTMTDRSFTLLTKPSFKVQKKPASTWNDVETVEFYNDWSYDYAFSSSLLSVPITTRVDARMFILTTKLQTGTVNATYKNKSGTSSIRTATVSGTKDGTAAFKVDAISNPASVTVNGYTYTVVTTCAKFALYYVNAYGGWDQFLIEGNGMETDSMERFLREMEYDNTSIVNRGTDNYVSEMTKTWTLNSGLLTDDEASRMHHLLNSCMVYLLDIATGNFIPVVISSNTCDYKTFKNQGNRMFNYQFSVQLAQNRIRR